MDYGTCGGIGGNDKGLRDRHPILSKRMRGPAASGTGAAEVVVE